MKPVKNFVFAALLVLQCAINTFAGVMTSLAMSRPRRRSI